MNSELRDPTLLRFHDALLKALHRAGRTPADASVTVAEIYQDLVPYRVARTDLGFEMNADYEHALMRLLAGEGGLLNLEPVEARDAIRTELSSPNPDVALYRRFAACDVRLGVVAVRGAGAGPAPAAVSDEAGAAGAGDSTGGPSDGEAIAALFEEEPWAHPDPGIPAVPEDAGSAPEAEEEEGASAGAGGPGPRPSAASTTPAATTSVPASPAPTTTPVQGEGAVCPACGEDLPRDREARFCPYCGSDLRPRCSACGELLAKDWRFCIACGSAVGGASGAA